MRKQVTLNVKFKSGRAAVVRTYRSAAYFVMP
jgi:hypothetical protein